MCRTHPERPLYDLNDDPQQQTDLARTNRRKLTELAQALRAHIQRGGMTPRLPGR